jgi:NAD(P)-dependent dehydrogenase (short-subunit alcohol dehydrogenase family)
MGLLEHRVAVITGGADGIGRAAALLFARQGAKVIVGDLRPRVENQSPFADLGIEQIACDVRDEADVRKLIETAAAIQGRLHVLVNNAGIGLVKQIPDVSEAEWDACLDTNLKGAFLASKHAIPHLRAAGGGAIVNTASNAGILPRAHDPVYCTSKAALIGLTRSLALSHAMDKIRVNCVCPGPVGDTGMINDDIAAAADPAAFTQKLINASPLARAYGRMIRPEEVAEAILYLASDASSMVSGTAIQIDGGKALGVPPQA